MATTTAALVKGVLGKDYDTNVNPDLSPYIDSAAAMMARVVACASKKGIPLNDAEKEIVERWLSAHFYAQSDRTFSAKSTDTASATMDGATDKFGQSTMYGQTAMRLDPSGCLEAYLSPERKAAGGFWLGKYPSSQIDYRLKR